jgi:hypothetical protein
MSARKWPFYTMAVGDEATMPVGLRTSPYEKLIRFKAKTGRVFMTRRRGEVRWIKRLA